MLAGRAAGNRDGVADRQARLSEGAAGRYEHRIAGLDALERCEMHGVVAPQSEHAREVPRPIREILVHLDEHEILEQSSGVGTDLGCRPAGESSGANGACKCRRRLRDEEPRGEDTSRGCEEVARLVTAGLRQQKLDER